MTGLSVAKYGAEHRRVWDDFVKNSKNGVFLFERSYLEYHADRFPDHSLLFRDDEDRLVAVLPATLRDEVLSSHAGLTFGGVVSDTRMKAELMLEVFEAARTYLQNQGVAKMIYKAIPHIYHRLPAEEDLYALFRNGARLFRRDVSSTIDLKEKLPFTKGRKYALKLASRQGLEVNRSLDFKTFMAIEGQVLETKYDAKPVHTDAEIEMLAQRFPENIKLFAASKAQEMLAGVVIYESSQVAHAQYIGVNDNGKRLGGLDLIINYLINDYYRDKRYLDFGISTENNGRLLNNGLIGNKESFGGRAVVYDFYEFDLDQNPK